MKELSQLSKSELKELKDKYQKAYDDFKSLGLKLNMARGKPSPLQLDESNEMLNILDDYHTSDGLDVRNYGILDGIPEIKSIFSDLLKIDKDNIIIGGSSSLNLMYDAVMRLYVFGTSGCKPWKDLEKVKFLCPVPGYDRHFAITEDLGIEMIPVKLNEDGPDMDYVMELVKNDDSIKGMWCVPLHANPSGVCYSDEVTEKLVSMETAAKDFRIFWDNAYGIHHVFKKETRKNVFELASKYNNENRILYFFSTSKITFPGAGISLVASGKENIAEIKNRMKVQIIGHDKINQLRHVKYFKNADGILKHMDKLAEILKPKFEIVLKELDKELSGLGIAKWSNPTGGYFVSVDVLSGCAKEVVRLAKEGGVILTDAGATYPYKNDPLDSNIRIAPSFPPVEELEKAMELFCICVKLAAVNKLLG